jgi:ATP citrate (pro-S)-lyase
MKILQKGIVKALQEFCQRLIDFKVSIYVRRGGPNYQEGLRVMKEVGNSLNIPIHVFGPETHMTAIVSMALNKTDIPLPSQPSMTTANFLLPNGNVCFLIYLKN